MYGGFGATGRSFSQVVSGDYNVTITGTGLASIAYNKPFAVAGNFKLSRTAIGNTIISEASVSQSTVGGMVNVAMATDCPLRIDYLKNETAGGTLSMADLQDIRLLKDTLKATINITDYRNALDIEDCRLSGNTTISNTATNGTVIHHIDGTFFDRNLSLTHRALNPFYDGFTSSLMIGNRVAGTDSITIATGAGFFELGYVGHPHQADSNLVINAPDGSINMDRVTFGGATDGELVQMGTAPYSINRLTASKTADKAMTFLAPVTAKTFVTFTTGYLKTDAINLLKMEDNTASSGAGNASHVIGPITKTGDDAFTFPLGNGTARNTLSISAPASTLDAFTASYTRANPQAAGDTTMLAASIDHLSRSKYWLLARTAGTSSVTVTLGYNQPNSGVVTNQSELLVAHWNGSTWLNEGNGGTTGTPFSGTVASANPIATFSPFTIDSSTAAGPPPIPCP